MNFIIKKFYTKKNCRGFGYAGRGNLARVAGVGWGGHLTDFGSCRLALPDSQGPYLLLPVFFLFFQKG
jgi:hypothetical protein